MPDLKEPDYESRIRAQIAQYAEPENLLKLPRVYHYWIAKHIRPRCPLSLAFRMSCFSTRTVPWKDFVNPVRAGVSSASAEASACLRSH
jgi:hypothetical protein